MKIKQYLKEAQLTDLVIKFTDQHNKKMDELELKAVKQFERYIKVSKEQYELKQIELSIEELDISNFYRNRLLSDVQRKMR
jgi:hypothetical protein